MNKAIISFLILLSVINSNAQQNIIPLYKGTAPGSESWTWSEKTIHVQDLNLVIDVSNPTLIAFLPSKPNGTAIIIAPGGAFHVLAIDLEGTTVAKWLNERGITAFVLKYRVVHDDPEHPENSIGTLMSTKNYKKLDSINKPVVKLAMEDGLAAMRYVREHASTYSIDPNKIGFMGFSAGGTVTLSIAYNATEKERPNFIAPVYAYVNGAIGNKIPIERTPAFLVAASNDDFGFAPQIAELYVRWQSANQPAELHIYEKGGHGFGTKKQNLPIDTWLDRFADWLKIEHLL
jgi:dienelactone hydrolase